MRRYWLLAGIGVVAAALAVGVTLAATCPYGSGGLPLGMAMGGGPPHRLGGPPGGPDGSAQPGPGPAGRRPGPLGPPRIVPALEGAMGTPMTDEQKKQVMEAAEAMRQKVRAAHEAFVQRLAEVTGLSVEKIREVLPPPPPPLPPPPPARQGEQMGPPPGGQGPQGGDQMQPRPGGRRGPPRAGKGPPPGGVAM
jgi:hypothetical protein